MTLTQDAEVDQPPNLDELHRRGATLVITYLGWWYSGKRWVREQEHAIVGHKPEVRFVMCSGPEDMTDVQSDQSADQVAHCELCTRGQTHTKAVHHDRWLQEIPF